jgi:hypothetical protein
MKRIVAAALLLAFWTGNSESVTTVSGLPGIACEYEAAGVRFWRVFARRFVCPVSIEVE